MAKLNEKYGLMTAMAVVFGTVVGSGIFFKADDVLKLTGGSITKALIAWTLGAMAMIFGALVFGEFAQRIQKSNGVVDYFEVAFGDLPAYLVGWFKWVVYISPLTSILAWVSALYTSILFNKETTPLDPLVWIIALVYVVVFYGMNYFAAVIAGKFQVSTSLIKLVPIVFVGVVGVIAGLSSGVLAENMSMKMVTGGGENLSIFSAVVATAFAYEGWILATSINGEIRNSKVNLPKALIYGTIAVFIAYVLYFMGITSVLPTNIIMENGDSSVYEAVNNLIGNVGGTVLLVFVVISCLGTLNGLIMGNIREPHSLALRGRGIAPKWMSKVNPKTDMPTNAAISSMVLTLVYLLLWYFSLSGTFGMYIGLDEIPIVSIYVVYLLLYIWYMFNFKDLSFVKRFVVPMFAIVGAGIILYGGITNPSIGMYLLISAGITLLGLLFYKKSSTEEV